MPTHDGCQSAIFDSRQFDWILCIQDLALIGPKNVYFWEEILPAAHACTRQIATGRLLYTSLPDTWKEILKRL
jgi:hypothetical protein